MKKFLMLVGVFAALGVFIYLSGCVIGPLPEASCAGMSLNEAMSIASQSDCMAEGALKAGTEMCNDVTKTWWLDLDVEREGCNPACVVDVENETAEVNWRCTGLIVE